jgi:predicted amidophosphoribosyltransferase
MPDQSCRMCGGELISHLTCSECRKPTQRICNICNNMTTQEYHQNCLNVQSLKTRNDIKIDILTIKKSGHRTKDPDIPKVSSHYEIYY